MVIGFRNFQPNSPSPRCSKNSFSELLVGEEGVSLFLLNCIKLKASHTYNLVAINFQIQRIKVIICHIPSLITPIQNLPYAWNCSWGQNLQKSGKSWLHVPEEQSDQENYQVGKVQLSSSQTFSFYKSKDSRAKKFTGLSKSRDVSGATEMKTLVNQHPGQGSLNTESQGTHEFISLTLCLCIYMFESHWPFFITLI